MDAGWGWCRPYATRLPRRCGGARAVGGAPGRGRPPPPRREARGGGVVSPIPTAPAATLRRLAHLQRLLEPGNIQPVYQPIVRTSDLEPIGYEGLARFPCADGLSNMPPDVTLAAAAEIGMREDLEVACWSAMAAAGS